MPRDFLQQALIDRVKQGPVKWDMWVTIGQPGDPETDPTVLWPSDRKEFKAGTLTFTAAIPQDGAECKNINYDPLVMSGRYRADRRSCAAVPLSILCRVIREAPARSVKSKN